MKFCFDIDGVLATTVKGLDYAQAIPIWANIQRLNLLYEQGHMIILFTARGSETGIDWREVTEHQMNIWAVKYHELHFGKPAADRYVDDRMATLFELDRIINEAGNS